MDSKFSMHSRLKSFRYAFKGLYLLFKNEHNARIHLVVMICVLIAGLLMGISSIEWIVIIFAIGLVFIAEILNTAIEELADHVSPGYHESIGKVKDLAAAAVLVASLVSLLAGLMVFIPRVQMLVRSSLF